MKPLKILSVMLAFLILNIMTGIGFAANDDALTCHCIPVAINTTNDPSLSFYETKCEELAVESGYNRARLRPPQKGETIIPLTLDYLQKCNASINGTIVCQGGTSEYAELAEPIVCAGAPSRF